MKILMTGFTPNQCNILRKKNPLYSGASAMLYALQASKNKNEIVNTYPTFDLKGYDRIVCGLYAGQAIASGYSEPCALMLAKARKAEIPVTFYLDDWHLQLIVGCLKTFSHDERQLRRHMTLLHGHNGKGDRYWQEMDKHMDDIMSVYDELRIGEFAGKMATVFIPWFMWVNNDGPEQILKWPKGVLHRYDPTNLFPVIKVAPQKKTRNWVLSTRYDFHKQIEEMNPTWPVVKYGCKKNGDNIVPNELDLLDAAYAPNWGIISHAYPPRAQGQWRNRFLFAHWCDCVLYTTGLEVLPDYSFHSLDEIEHMPDSLLYELAKHQATNYLRECWSKEVAALVVNDTIKG